MRSSTKLAQLLTQKHLTISIAESCTGGLVSHQLTDIPGASAFLLMAVIAYDNQAKMKVLKVPHALIAQHGAVSEAVALSMARGVRKILKTDIGLAITGIAGPSGGSAKKPVGTVFIAINTAQETLCQHYVFKGTRTRIKSQATNAALNLLIRLVK